MLVIKKLSKTFRLISTKNTLSRLAQCIIREQLLQWRYEKKEGSGSLHVEFPNSQCKLIATHVKLYAFNRIYFYPNSQQYLQTQSGSTTATIKALIYHLSLEFNTKEAFDFQSITKELNNNIQNTILTDYQYRKFCSHTKKIAVAGKFNTFYDLIAQLHHKQHILRFEQFASQGHPFHPCNKTKLGFSKQDVLNYASEFDGPPVGIIVAALHHSIATIETEQQELNYNKWFAEFFPDAMTAWKVALTTRELDPKQYYPIPIHPWQALHQLPKLFNALLSNRLLLLLPEVTIPCKPTLSFRTLMPIAENTPYQIKLPVAVQATSALRTVSAASIHNSPRISQLLRYLMKKEHALQKHLHIVFDSIGIRVSGKCLDNVEDLPAIFRDPISPLLHKSQMAIVSAALFQRSPLTHQPLIIEMIDSLPHQNSQSHCLNYFETFCNILIRACLPLYIQYGIALEAHQQNTLVVFENKLPVKIIMRDLGGIRIYQPALEKAGFSIDFFPNSAIITGNKSEVRSKLQHTVYQCQLNELIMHCSVHYNIHEGEFWSRVAKITLNCFDGLTKKVNENTLHQERDAFFQPYWATKNLLLMRLTHAYDNYVYGKAPNPLHTYQNYPT